MRNNLLILLSLICFSQVYGQKDNLYFSGSLQSDFLIPETDPAIGTEKYKEKVLTNTYLDLSLSAGHSLSVGTRLEYLKHPLPGYEKDFAGWGIPYFYATGQYKGVEITGGDFYEQFGNGLILRTYEERSLGIDNSIRGGRIMISHPEGIRTKLLAGKQRHYWKHNHTPIWGIDTEVNLEEWIKPVKEKEGYWTLGFSYVGKHEKDEDIYVAADERLHLPLTIAAFDVRMQYQQKGYNLFVDYAWKINDPSFDNGYNYDKGQVLLLSGSYSKKGASILLQAKRSENMVFRSLRSITGASSFINHLPAFTTQHTYALASLYPYATRPLGEWAFQGEIIYRFKPATFLGGKEGALIKLHGSHIRPLSGDKEFDDEIYYQDIHIKWEKRFSRLFGLNAMYMYQKYNQWIVEGHADNGRMIRSHIWIAESNYKINNKWTWRSELQYLHSKQGEKDWLYGLVEFSFLPSFLFSASDMYNLGTTNLHYYRVSVSYSHKAHYLQVGYGRNRPGYNCSGGICRYVPASKGLFLAYQFNF